MALNKNLTRNAGVWKGTQADILAEETASTVVPGQVYETSDQPEKLWYLGVATNKLELLSRSVSNIESIVDARQYIKSVAATGSATPEVDSNGVFRVVSKISAQAGNQVSVNVDGLFVPESAADYITSVAESDTATPSVVEGALSVAVRVSADAGNAILAKTDGIWAREVTIHPDSANYMEKTAAGEIKLKALAIINKHNATAYASLTAFVAALNDASFVPSPALGLGDIVIGSASMGNFMYVGDGSTPYSNADFEVVEGLEITDTQIRSKFSAGNGIDYSSVSGQIASKLSTDAGNDVVFGNDNGLYVSVENTIIGVTDENNTEQALDLKGTLNDIYSVIAGVKTNSVTGATNGATKSGNDVKLGGTLTETTTLDGGDLRVERMHIAVFNQDANDNPTTSTGDYAQVFVSTTGNLWVVLPA